eukprot:UN00379
MMNFQLSIDVRNLVQVSPRPSYLRQIEYLNIVQETNAKSIKSFNFKDAPNNCQFVMGVFDHVSNILNAVQSPICAGATDRDYDCINVLKEMCLKPSKIRTNKLKRSVAAAAGSSSSSFKRSEKCKTNSRVLSLGELVVAFTPTES